MKSLLKKNTNICLKCKCIKLFYTNSNKNVTNSINVNCNSKRKRTPLLIVRAFETLTFDSTHRSTDQSYLCIAIHILCLAVILCAHFMDQRARA